MGKKNNIIEINGKRYDAHTGAAIGHTPIKPPVSHHDTTRKAAKRLPSHAPQRSTTLMRKAVKRPSPSLKRRVKVVGDASSLVSQPAAPPLPKLSFGSPDPKRLQHASHIKKSRLISHFNQSQPDYTVPVTVVASSQPALAAIPSKPAFALKTPKRQPAPAASDIFERAVQQATSHLEPAPKIHKKRRLHLARKHARA